MNDRSRVVRDNAVVIRTYKLGEADRIVVVLTRQRGKIRAVAKGVRRTRSKFGARLEPGSHVDAQFYVGRGQLETVTQVEAVEHHDALRTDLDRLHAATTVLEVADLLSLEHHRDTELFEMVTGALRTLARHDSPLVLAGFLWKALAHAGFAPIVDACVACGSSGPLVSFDVEGGGTRCEAHRVGVAIDAQTLDVLAAILSGRLATVMDTTPAAVSSTVERLGVTAVEHHVERRLRSVAPSG
ncbi:MAG: DNA repair protein RecO [Acidimicrobiales bacterium]